MGQGWLVSIAGGTVAGTALVSFSFSPAWPWLCLAAAAGCLSFLRSSAYTRFLSIACFAAAFSSWHASTVLHAWQTAPALPEQVSGTALVVGMGERHERSVTAPLRFEQCDEGACPERLLLGQFPQYAVLSRGERLEVMCRVTPPDNEAAGFDYRGYLAKDGIAGLCWPTKWEKLPEREWYTPLFSFRGHILETLTRHIPQPESALVSGLLLGGDEGLSRGTQAEFKTAGLSHIVAVSGYNVTIVAETLLFALVFLGLRRRQAFWLILLGVWIFVLLSGASASAVRAGIMGSLVFTAFQFGRPQLGMRALCLAAAAMLFWNPLLLRSDAGFQLSFAATTGIMLLAGELAFPAGLLGAAGRLALSTFAAQLFVAPLLLFHFHTLSLIGLLANLFVLPLVPFTMLLGALTAVAGLVHGALGMALGYAAYLPARAIFLVTETAVSVPYGEVALATFPAWAVVLWYAVLILGYSVFHKRKTYAA